MDRDGVVENEGDKRTILMEVRNNGERKICSWNLILMEKGRQYYFHFDIIIFHGSHYFGRCCSGHDDSVNRHAATISVVIVY